MVWKFMWTENGLENTFFSWIWANLTNNRYNFLHISFDTVSNEWNFVAGILHCSKIIFILLIISNSWSILSNSIEMMCLSYKTMNDNELKSMTSNWPRKIVTSCAALFLDILCVFPWTVWCWKESLISLVMIGNWTKELSVNPVSRFTSTIE